MGEFERRSIVKRGVKLAYCVVPLCLAAFAACSDSSTPGGESSSSGGVASSTSSGGTASDASPDGASADAGVDSAPDAGADSGGADAGTSGLLLDIGTAHTCARLDGGAVKCWGFNMFGQLGLGDTQPRGDGPNEMGPNLPPADLGPGRTAVALSAGGNHTCARLDNGTVKCWGHNQFGQLGLGDVQDRGVGPNQMGANLPPVDLGPGRIAVEVKAGENHTCARLDDGAVKCWGINGFGQLGLGDTQYRGNSAAGMGANLPAVDLGPGRAAVQLSSRGNHTCARLDNGTVKCWGQSYAGQLGLQGVNRGSAPNQMGANLPAVDVGPGRTVLQLAAGFSYTCARLDDGTVKCWGINNRGELGVGDRLTRGDGPGEMGANLPALDFGPGRTAVELNASVNHTCARLDNGTVKCWGDNAGGQLGLGDQQNRGDDLDEMGATLPTIELGLGRTAVQLSGGAGHTCATLDDGSAKCWGSNGIGQLGLGDKQSRGVGPNEMGANLPTVQLK